MKSRVLLLTLILAVAVALVGCGGTTATPSTSAPAAKGPEEVQIGVMAPLTGNNAEYGQIWKKAMDLALSEITKQNAIPGKTLKLVIEDTQSDPKQAATIAKKFADDPKIVAVIGDFSSSASLAAAPILLEAKKVQLSPTASDPKFAASGEYMFSIVGSQLGEAPFLADMALKQMGGKKIGVMFINNDWGNVTKDIFVDSVKKSGGAVVEEVPYLPTDKDFRASLTRLQAKQPDVLFVAGFYDQVSLMQKQRADLGWKVPVLCPSSCYSPLMIQQGGDAAEGQKLAAVFFPTDPSAKVQAFVKSYKEVAGQEPNQFAALAYDSVWLLASTIAKTGTDSTKIREGLANFASGYTGVTGEMKFNSDRIVVKKYVPLQIKNGQFELWAQ